MYISLLKRILLFSVIACELLTSCSKKKDDGSGSSGSLYELLFEQNVLNRNFIVSRATNNGADLTSTYNGYVFVLQKTDYYHGPLQVTKGSSSYSGTWSANSDFSQLVITLPNPPAEFDFLSRAWRFTKKDLPELQLAPWGATDPYVLYMYRQ